MIEAAGSSILFGVFGRMAAGVSVRLVARDDWQNILPMTSRSAEGGETEADVVCNKEALKKITDRALAARIIIERINQF